MKRKLFLAAEIVLGCVLVGAVLFFFLKKSPEQKAFDAALAQAKQGNAQAQATVAAAYLSGNPIKQNAALAVDWYLKSAAQGYAPAAYELAQLYLVGEQVERDIASGVSYLKLAAAKKHAGAQYSLGRLYQTGTDGLPQHEGQAVWWWLWAAQNGDEQAQSALEQTKADNPELLQQVQAVFEQEQQAVTDGAAAFWAAQAYQQGKWVEADAAQALAFLEKAAEQKHPQALFALFEMYSQPNGLVPVNEEKGLEYLQQAAEAGLPQAQYEVGQRIYQVAQTPQEYQVAWQWFELAGQQQYAPAIYMSGIMRMQGLAGKADAVLALANFQQAAEQGYADAQYVLGQSYWYGAGVKPSKSQAVKWLKLAQENGNGQAAELLNEINK